MRTKNCLFGIKVLWLLRSELERGSQLITQGSHRQSEQGAADEILSFRVFRMKKQRLPLAASR